MKIIITLDDDTIKAMAWDIVDINAWVNNAIFNKDRQCKDEICRIALEDHSNTVLSLADKVIIREALGNLGIILTTTKRIPEAIKRQIVQKANIKSAAQRKDEGLGKEVAITLPLGMGAVSKPGFWDTLRNSIRRLGP